MPEFPGGRAYEQSSLRRGLPTSFLPWSHMAVIYPFGEVQVNALHVAGDDGGARAKSYVQKLHVCPSVVNIERSSFDPHPL